jgi:hypothetical protein
MRQRRRDFNLKEFESEVGLPGASRQLPKRGCSGNEYARLAPCPTNNRGVDHFQQLEHLNRELDKVVERVRGEYDMSYEAVIGALQVLSVKLGLEAISQEDEDEPEKTTD